MAPRRDHWPNSTEKGPAQKGHLHAHCPSLSLMEVPRRPLGALPRLEVLYSPLGAAFPASSFSGLLTLQWAELSGTEEREDPGDLPRPVLRGLDGNRSEIHCDQCSKCPRRFCDWRKSSQSLPLPPPSSLPTPAAGLRLSHSLRCEGSRRAPNEAHGGREGGGRSASGPSARRARTQCGHRPRLAGRSPEPSGSPRPPGRERRAHTSRKVPSRRRRVPSAGAGGPALRGTKARGLGTARAGRPVPRPGPSRGRAYNPLPSTPVVVGAPTCRAGSARSSPSGRRSPARPPPEALRRRRERRGEAALTCLCRAGLTCREFDFGVWPQVGLGKRRAREKSPRVAGAAAPGLSARGTPPSSVLYLLGSGSRRPAMTCTWPLGPWAAA